MGLGFLVKQGNAYYIADYQGVGQNGWNTVTFQADTPQQLASDFTLIAWTGSVKPPATPNFGTTGAPSRLGISRPTVAKDCKLSSPARPTSR